ncbi:MAG: ATP-dependent DNA helicase RecG [Deltaproteobacteria bacterium]|nr:MAG: ATP-dependent DNA helicase RecG [Deltaproteobacteria bacterium]
MSVLETSLQYIKGVGPKLSSRLSKRGLKTVRDALYFFPRTYQDRRKKTPLREVVREGEYLVEGEIVSAGPVTYRSGKGTFDVVISDGTGYAVLKWFNFHLETWNSLYRPGRRVLVYGTARGFLGNFEFLHPDVEFVDGEDKGLERLTGIVPVYPEVEGIHQRTLRKIVERAVEAGLPAVEDPLPEELLREEGLPGLKESLRQIHRPDDDADVEALCDFRSPFHRRIIFDEFLTLQLGLARRKYLAVKEQGISIPWEKEIVEEIKRRLPFQLTEAQRRVVNEILRDMKRGEPMNRLLQGDVGSGKTIVAWIASLIAWNRGYQVAVMAPTEILAEQHYINFTSLSRGLNVKIVLLTSSTPPKEKEELKSAIARGEADIVIGTHALIQEDVEFSRLALVIVDEQHRFGVYQRLKLREKGSSPHLLVMTATPIPRTLAMTLYGDLDVSVIDEMPPGRTPVTTKVIEERDRARMFAFIREELKRGGQAYIVFPLVEESEKLDLKAATDMYEKLREGELKGFPIGLLHGRMKQSEKEEVVRKFREGKISVLVSTTVIEVGVDVPSATVMVVENAERFGLSQLHQLRGRVGRGGKKSWCFLVAGRKISDDARRRLSVMEKTTDGFRVAEEDLIIRGPGDFVGTRQSGFPDIIFGNIIRDTEILSRARERAFRIIEEDPNLSSPKYRKLRELVTSRWGNAIDFAFV